MKVILYYVCIMNLYFRIYNIITQSTIYGLRNGIILSIIKSRKGDEYINVLSSEESIIFTYFYRIKPIAFTQFNKRHKYHLLSNNVYLDCIQQRIIDCSLKSIKDNITIMPHINPNYLNQTPIIDNSLVIKEFPDKTFILLWATIKPSITYQLYNLKTSQICSLKSLSINSFNHKRPLISVDTFPNNNHFIIAYSHDSTNTISIFNKRNILIRTFISFLKTKQPIFVRVLNDDLFISCHLLNQPKNYCRVGNINNQTNHNTFPIKIPSNVYSITSISLDKFVLFWLYNNKEIRVNAFNLKGELLSELLPINIPYHKTAKVTEINSEIVDNDVLTLFVQIKEGNKLSFLYQLYNVGLVCYDNILTVNSFSAIGLNFENYIVFNRNSYSKKQTLLIRILGLPSQGILKIKHSNEEISLGKNYYLNQLEYYASLPPINTESKKKIDIKYIILSNEREETNICSLTIQIYQSNNYINLEKGKQNKDEYEVQSISKFSLHDVMMIIIMLIQIYSTLKENKYHKKYCSNTENSRNEVMKYYFKKKFNENITKDINYFQILLHLIKVSHFFIHI